MGRPCNVDFYEIKYNRDIYCVIDSHRHHLETSELRKNNCVQGLQLPVWL